MDAEAREILGAVLEGQRVAEAERKADRNLLQVIIGKLDRLNATVDEHSTKLDRLNATVDEHSAKLDRLNATVDEHSAKLTELGAGLDWLKKQVNELGARDRYFLQKLSEHDMGIALLNQQLKAE